MTHKVESSPIHAENGWPWIIIPDAKGRASIRITNQALAERVAKALDLLDGVPFTLSDGQGLEIVTIDLPESEIMQRAREAAAYYGHWHTPDQPDDIRAGKLDGWSEVKIAAAALRDLSKPLAEIVPPPVDPDLIEARKIAAKMFDPPVGSSSWIFTKVDGSETEEMSTDQARQGVLDGELDGTRDVQAALAAIKRGRELADSPMERLARQLGVSPHQC